MVWDDRYVSVAGSGAHDGSSPANEWTLAEALAAYAAGHRLNVRAGTYSSGATDRTFGVVGTATAPILWVGYNSTPGDLDTEIVTQRTPGTDSPLFASTTGRYHCSSAYNWFSNIAFTSGYTVAGTVMARGGNHKFLRCRFENSASATGPSAVDVVGHFTTFDSCHMRRTAATSGYMVVNQSNSHVCYTNCIFESGGTGISLGNGLQSSLVGCIFRGQGVYGISGGSAQNIVVIGNTFYDIGTSAIRFSAAINTAIIRHNYFHTIAGYAIRNDLGTDVANIHVDRNVFHNVTGQVFGLTNDFQNFAAVDSLDELVNAAGNDFTPKPTSNAYSYALLLERDGPLTYRDFGAVQHFATGGVEQPASGFIF